MDNRDSGPRLVLASASPRRKELLQQLSDRFEIRVSGVDEDESPSHMEPAEVAAHLAFLKAKAVGTRITDGLVLGADTVIDFKGEMLGKPTDKNAAVSMLKRLRGEVHSVVTGISLLAVETQSAILSWVRTEVAMKNWPDSRIEQYVESGEPMDKAGAYAIQGLGRELVDSIDGCYNNVVGLPLCEVSNLLNASGYRTVKECRSVLGSACPRLT